MNVSIHYNFYIKFIFNKITYVSVFTKNKIKNLKYGVYNYYGKKLKYFSLVFPGIVEPDDVMSYLHKLEEKYKCKILLDDIKKSIHIKHFYNVVTDKGVNELWIEYNFNNLTKRWESPSNVDSICSGEKYSCIKGMEKYEKYIFGKRIFIPVRIVGSWNTMFATPLFSTDKYQYLVINHI